METLRHRIDIEAPVRTQDAETGAITTTWKPVHEDVPCTIKPLSVRDFIQSQAIQADVTVRVMFRFLENIDNTMRLRGVCGCHRDKVYNPAGFLEDDKTGREYITAPCSQGVNRGDT